jgi:ferric-dicitrate binding protein FerR (iron transport regulator)
MIPMDEPRDRLIDILLREELGGEQPPDLTERVLARAFPSRFRFPVRKFLLAAGVLLAIGALTWSVWPTYLEPRASGSYEVVGGGKVQRGATLRTKDQPALLEMGGYTRIDIKPNSRVRIAGEKYAESVALESGAVGCRVDRGKGAFSVLAPFGNVAVTGTEFDVHAAGAGEDRSVVVRVAVGAVALAGEWGGGRLSAGEETTFALNRERKPEARAGTQFGTVTAKLENWIDIRTDSDEKVHRYRARWLGERPGRPPGPDRAMIEAIVRTPIGARVKFDWMTDERPCITRLEIIERPRND